MRFSRSTHLLMFLSLATLMSIIRTRLTHLLMFLSLATLTSIIRTGLPFLVQLIDLVNYFKWLTQMVNFPTWIPDCDSHSPALLDVFLSSDASICSTIAFPPHWKILIMLLFQFPWLSIKFTVGWPVSLHSLWLFSSWLRLSSWSFDRCSMGGYL